MCSSPSIPSRSRSRWTTPRPRWARRCRTLQESTRATYRAAVGQIAAQQAQVDGIRPHHERYLALPRPERHRRHAGGYPRPRLTLSAQATLASLQQNCRHPAGQAERQSQFAGREAPGISEGQGAGGRSPAPARPCRGARAVRRHRQRSGFALQPGTLVISAMSAFTTTSAVGLIGKRSLDRRPT